MTTEPLDWHYEPAVAPAPTGRPIVTALTFLAVAVAMLLSAFALDSNGIPYTEAGGSPLFKIHPMTYLAVFAFIAAALSRGNPLKYLVSCAVKFPGAAYFLILLLMMILWTLLVQHQPLTSLIDTFLPATLFIFLISDLTPRQHRLLTVFIHIVLNANAILGVIEVSTGWRLTPITLQGVAIDWEWRASAFLGHPLENAMITGVYLLMMLFGADRGVKPPLRIGIIALQIIGLVVFGGRTAMVLAFLLVAVRVIILAGSLMRGMRFDPRVAGFIVMMLPIIVGIGLLAYDLGAFDRMIERFTNDGGSADTRVSIIRIFNSFPLYDLLMGPDPDVLVAKAYIEGTTAGIESFVFGFFLQSGMLISIIFFGGLAAISFDLWRVGGRVGLLHITYFFIVAAGAASLSVKSQTFAQFVILFTTIEAMPSLLDRTDS